MNVPLGRVAHGQLRARAASPATSSSYTSLTTIAREQALHFCPENPKADFAIPSTALSRSALAVTMAGFLPPISVSAGRANGPAVSVLAIAGQPRPSR